MKKYLLIMIAMFSMSYAQEAGDRSLSFSFGGNGDGSSMGTNIEDIDTAAFSVSYGKFTSDSLMLSAGITGSLEELTEMINLSLDYHFMALGSGSMYALLNVDKKKDVDAETFIGVGYLMPLALSEKMYLNLELTTWTDEIADDFYIGGGLTWIF